jgi:hypothetical protein
LLSCLPSFAAVRQSPAVIVANANKGKSGFRLPGIPSSASALQLQVQPFCSWGGLATDLFVPKTTDGQDRLP